MKIAIPREPLKIFGDSKGLDQKQQIANTVWHRRQSDDPDWLYDAILIYRRAMKAIATARQPKAGWTLEAAPVKKAPPSVAVGPELGCAGIPEDWAREVLIGCPVDCPDTLG